MSYILMRSLAFFTTVNTIIALLHLLLKPPVFPFKYLFNRRLRYLLNRASLVVATSICSDLLCPVALLSHCTLGSSFYIW